MAVNIEEINSVYDSLYNNVLGKYDAMYSADKIDAETYAQLVGQLSSSLVQLSGDLVQKQEQLDKEVAIKDEQAKIAYVDRVIKDKEAASMGMDSVIKAAHTAKADDEDNTYVYTPKYEIEVE